MAAVTLGEPIQQDVPTITLGEPTEETAPVITLGAPIEEPESDRTMFSDIARGVGAGVVDVPLGISELAAAGIDLAFDTDFSRDVSGFGNSVKEYLGFTPETTAGKAAEAITTFGSVLIPFVGWASRASAVANGAKVLPATSRLKKSADAFGKSDAGRALFKGDTAFSRRARLAAGTSLGGGAIEMLVAPDGTHTLADAFEVLPDVLQTESDTGLQGRDEAGRRIRNRLRLFPESVGVGVAFEAAFPVLGAVGKGVSYVPGVAPTARLMTKGFDALAESASTAFGGKVKKYFASTGELDRPIFEDLRTVEDVTSADAKKAEELLLNFDKTAKKLVTGMELDGRGKQGVQRAWDDLLLYLEGDRNALQSYKPEARMAAQKMREQVDSLTDTVAKELEYARDLGYADKDLISDALSVMEESKGMYLRRLFEGAFSIDTQAMNAVRQSGKYRDAVKQLSRYTNGDESLAALEVEKFLGAQKLEGGIDPEAALPHIIKAEKEGAKIVQARPLYDLAEGMFKKRSKLLDKAPALRELMNEVRDPRVLFMTTVSDLSKFSASSQFYRSLAGRAKTYTQAQEQFAAGGRPFIISGKDIAGKSPDEAQLLSMGYKRLPQRIAAGEGEVAAKSGEPRTIFSSEYGALSGDFVASELHNAITIPARTSNIATELLSLSLVAKGVSQMGKTFLNPVAQVRNFGSAAFMVGANGNFARQMGLGETLDAVFKKITGASAEETDNFVKMIGDLGLVDENLAINEMKQLRRESMGMKTEKFATAVNSAIDRVPGVRQLQDIYSNTDTYWKAVGFVGEKAKYSSAFRKANIDPENMSALADDFVRAGLAPRTSELTGNYSFLDVYAADLVKETMPIYSRTPAVIQKGIRKIPFYGNFTAFPAEVIRNTTNIVRRGLRELSFEAPDTLVSKIGPENARVLERQIRAIGANRLMSYTASAVVIPTAIARASYKATGITDEQVDDMKSGMADWMKGSQLVSIAPIKKDGWEYFNLSYMMPYDFALAPARAALEVYERNGKLGKGEAESVGESLWTAFELFMNPFAGESLFAERVLDVVPPGYGGRGGKTEMGGEVYLPSQDIGTKLGNSFRHVGAGFSPGIVDLFIETKASGVQQGRLTRAVTGDPTGRGQTTDIYSEMLALSGIRPQMYKPAESLSFAGFEFTDLRSQSLRDFSRVAQSNNATEKDVVDAYDRVNADVFRHQKAMFGAVKAAKAAGLDDGEIFKALKLRSNLGNEELFSVLSGIFRPVTISDQLVQNVFMETYAEGQTRKIDQLPLAELYNRMAQYQGRSLMEPSLFETKPQQTGGVTLGAPIDQPSETGGVTLGAPIDQTTSLEPVAATTPPPVVAQAGAAPAPSAAPAPTTQKRPAALMGSDPFEAFKNMLTFGD